MDWIERWFGVSPDGGSGALELLVVAVLFVIAVALLGGHRVARQSADRLRVAIARVRRRVAPPSP